MWLSPLTTDKTSSADVLWLYNTPFSHLLPILVYPLLSQQLLLQAKGKGKHEHHISEASALDMSGCLQYQKKPSWRSTNLCDNSFWIIYLIVYPHQILEFQLLVSISHKGLLLHFLWHWDIVGYGEGQVRLLSPLSVCVPSPSISLSNIIMY